MGDFSMDFPDLNSTMTCLVLPPRSNSYGVAGSFTEKTHFLTYSMPLFELQMGIILTLSHVIRFFAKPFGISSFVSCILAGMILGPNGLGKFDFMKEVIFPHDSQDIIYTAVMLGYNIYIFLAAVKLELGMVLKTGPKALSIGIMSALIPFVTFSIYRAVQPGDLTLENNFVVVIGVLTSLPVVANVVDQLKLANTKLGRLALASGLVADVSGIGVFIIQVFLKTRSLDDTMRMLLPVLIFLLTLAFVIRPAVDWVIKSTPDGKPLSNSFLYMIMAIAIAIQLFFTLIGQSHVLAPFLFGLALPSGAPLGSALVEKFGSFTNGVLMHILIPTAFMRADLYLFLSNLANLQRTMAILFSAFLLKMVGCILPSMILKMPMNEALALGFILNYTGVVQLNISSIYRDVHLYREEVYGLLAYYILFNAVIFPIIIKKLYQPSKRYEGYHARNILSVKPRTELKILTCIYGQDNADSYIKLLDTIHPTKESPISIYALHIVELIGRYVPILVTHSKLKPISTTTSQKIIYAFNQYEKNNWDSVSIQLFTSLSSFPLMHEDIFDIALEKKTSLIILPLHRRWSVHGYIEAQDKGWRNVNRDVLDKAPCSVAIFFSRGNFGRPRSTRSMSSNLSICMIFFGGNDDREALIIAKKMLKNPEVTLTVIHYLPNEAREIDESEDHMYDVVLLDEIRQTAMMNERIDYRAYVVQDGPETILKVRSMANQFDLFIVGRRFGVQSPQTSGLSEWSELPELGIIGDLFASKDLDTRTSVLVVQQQKKVRQLLTN